jgi:hypothetical protein
VHTLSEVATGTEKLKLSNKLIGSQQVLTRIQNWYFDQDYFNVHYWNQMFCLRILRPISAEWLEQSINIVANSHDIFTLFFLKTGNIWGAHYTNEKNYEYRRVNLSELSIKEQLGKMSILSQEAQKSLHIENGKLMIFLHFELSEIESRLIIVSHHLIIDGVS